MDKFREAEDRLYEEEAEKIRAAQPQFAALIHEVTGWKGGEELAEWMIELLITQQGRSPSRGVRPPCWRDHKPSSVSEFTDMLTTTTSRAADDPFILGCVREYRQQLIEQFELGE